MNSEIKIGDIPEAFVESVLNGLKHYLVTMLGSSEPYPIPFGSGTFVRVGNIRGILTAAHVWHKAKAYQEIFFILTDRVSTAFSIKPRHISPKEIWGGEENEWGPDLAFMELAPNDAAELEGSKSFLNLSKQKIGLTKKPPDTDKGLWVITGLVAEFSRVEHKPEERAVLTTANCQAMFSIIHNTSECEGYDYFEAGARMGLEGVPESFGGVSGGGVWQVDIRKNEETGDFYWDEKKYLRGVAFWEEDQPSEGLKAIRFHGPKSIFETAWKEWGFPEGT